MENGGDSWARIVDGYLRTLKVNLISIARYKKDKIKWKFHEWRIRQWKQNMKKKSTIEISRRYKDKV